LEDITNKKDSDLFDILVHIAFDSPLLTRKQKADKIKKEKMDYFDFYSQEAKEII
jgi:type I restriction enzyme, R subunit